MLELSSEMVALLTSFLFVFAIIYALLIYTNIFTQSRRSAVIISLVIAFFSVVYGPMVSLLQNILPIASLLLVFLFFIVFIKKLIEGGGIKDSAPITVSLAILLVVLASTWGSLGLYLPYPLTPDTVLWIIGIFVILLIFLGVYYHNPKGEQK